MSDVASKLDHPPTLADIDALPPHMKGEIVDGVFYAMPRPRGVHQNVADEVAVREAVTGSGPRRRAGVR